MLEQAKKAWHGVRLDQPDWGVGSHSIALNLHLDNQELIFHLILNAFWEPLDFELPTLIAGEKWRRWIDTGLPSPQDIVEWQTAETIPDHIYHAGPRFVVVLAAGSAFQKFHHG